MATVGVPIDLSKKYKTIDGKKIIRFQYRDNITFPILAFYKDISDQEFCRSYTEDGFYWSAKSDDSFNLVPDEEETKGAKPMKTLDVTKPVRTRDGRKARILCSDFVSKDFPIVAAVTQDDGTEATNYYTLAGCYWRSESACSDDLINIDELHPCTPELERVRQRVAEAEESLSSIVEQLAQLKETLTIYPED